MDITTFHLNEAPETEPTGTVSRTVLFSAVRILREDGPELLSVTEFADEAHVTTQAVRKMIAEGRLEAHKIGEQYAINRDKLNEYLTNR